MYPISIDYAANRGILNKMEYQWTAFSELTETTDLICNSIRGPVLNGQRMADYALSGRGFNSLNHYAWFYSHVGRCVDTGNYDFLYIRYPLAMPSFMTFLRRAKRANPHMQIVVEIATFPYRRELQGVKRRILRTFDDLGKGWLKNYVDAIVTFYGQSQIFGVPCIQLTNGVDVKRVKLRTDTRPHEGFAMVAVGNLAERHGVDRVIRGVARYIQNPDAKSITLHVVGEGPATAKLTALARQLGVEDQVRFHGLKSGGDLDAIFDGVDVALDSLALHRLHLARSSSLKAREYCARGIPFVLASDDPDFPETLPFVHRVRPDDEPLDVEAVLGFHSRLDKRAPSIAREMRRYAEAHVSWKAKLQPLVQRLQSEHNGEPLAKHLR